MLLKIIAKTGFRLPWRRKQLQLLLVTVGLLSFIAAMVPQRSSSQESLWQESFLAIQLLTALGFALIVTIPSMAPEGFMWDMRRIGPLPTKSELVLLSQAGGQMLAWFCCWAILLLVQVLCLQWVTDAHLALRLVKSSFFVLASGVVLISWAQLAAAVLPTSTALLSTVGVVALSHFLLTSNPSGPVVLALSPGIGLIFGAATSTVEPSSIAQALGVTMGAVGISNLLSTWALESWRGSLGQLDRISTRS